MPKTGTHMFLKFDVDDYAKLVVPVHPFERNACPRSLLVYRLHYYIFMCNVFMRWFGHMEWMSEVRLVKRIYIAGVGETRGMGRPRARWLRKVPNEKGLRRDSYWLSLQGKMPIEEKYNSQKSRFGIWIDIKVNGGTIRLIVSSLFPGVYNVGRSRTGTNWICFCIS